MNQKWYFKNTSLFVLFLLIGPLMLPFLWLKPDMSLKAKILWTLLIAGITYVSIVLMANSVKSIMEYYSLIFPSSPTPS